jgi:hypothetical protein
MPCRARGRPWQVKDGLSRGGIPGWAEGEGDACDAVDDDEQRGCTEEPEARRGFAVLEEEPELSDMTPPSDLSDEG